MRMAIERSGLPRIPRSGLLSLMVVAALGLAAPPAFGAFHLMTIQEVFLGPPGDGVARLVPLTEDQRAQYVMLRMTSGGQTFVGGASIRVEDADGNILGTFGTFGGNVANGGGACSFPSCPAIVIGTQAAKNLFTFAFNQIVDGEHSRVALPASGGRACFVAGSSVMDCVAWGSFNCRNSGNCLDANTIRNDDFSANSCDTDFGAPASALEFGRVLAHTGSFDCLDKDNGTNYTLQFPHPANNAGANNNTDSDGDGLVDQLDCNDGAPSILWPAVEVQNETVVGHPVSTISWSSQAATAGSGATYDVVRGSLANLSGFTDAACLAPNLAAVSTNDASVPTPGHGFYYVERAGTGAGCVGTYGSGFSPATSRDPALGAICP